jgi:hypothetical protein
MNRAQVCLQSCGMEIRNLYRLCWSFQHTCQVTQNGVLREELNLAFSGARLGNDESKTS